MISNLCYFFFKFKQLFNRYTPKHISLASSFCCRISYGNHLWQCHLEWSSQPRISLRRLVVVVLVWTSEQNKPWIKLTPTPAPQNRCLDFSQTVRRPQPEIACCDNTDVHSDTHYGRVFFFSVWWLLPGVEVEEKIFKVVGNCFLFDCLSVKPIKTWYNFSKTNLCKILFVQITFCNFL